MVLRRTLVRAAPSFGRVTDSFAARLASLVETSTNRDVCVRHGDDESHHPPVPPDIVAFPKSTAEVQAVVKLCGEAKVPLIPFGAGTSLEGHITAPFGGVSLDLGLHMTAVLETHCEDMDARVEAGCTRLSLNRSLHQTVLQPLTRMPNHKSCLLLTRIPIVLV
jgi:D-lactate dehydrogenase (cytochrome)